MAKNVQLQYDISFIVIASMPTTPQFTLRTAMILPFVLIFFVTLSAIAYLQNRSYERVVIDVSNKQLSSIAENVNLSLKNFIDEPFRVNNAIRDSIVLNKLYLPYTNLTQLQQYLSHSLLETYHGLLQIDLIGYGNTKGGFVSLRRDPQQQFTLMLKDDSTGGDLVIFDGKNQNNGIRSIVKDYDPRVRPWYLPASVEKKSLWSDIYSNVDEKQEVTISATAPIIDNGTVHGIVVTDIRIDSFNLFLKKLNERTKATIYVMDKDARLVAHSDSSSILSWGEQSSNKGNRLLTSESNNQVIIQSSGHIDDGQLFQDGATVNFATYIQGERYFNQIVPFVNQSGIEWSIVVSIAESELLGQIPQSQYESWIIGITISLFGVAFGLILFNYITRPITVTAAAARDIASGNWDSEMPKPGNIYETTMLVQAFTDMTKTLKSSFDEIKAQLTYDSLTMLYSREGLIEASMATKHKPHSLFLIGIDNFRDVNDSIGHINGDRLLVIISERLKEITPSDSYIARIGGDEFAIYCPSITTPEDVHLFTLRAIECFASPFSINGQNMVIKASVGVAQNHNSEEFTVLLRNVGIALSNAKHGTSHISYYRPEMGDESVRKTKAIADIKQAIDKKEFIPFYQPLIDLESGKVIGAEALARWLSPTKGLIPPLEFIHIAEDHDLIGDIGAQILYTACMDTSNAIAQGIWDKDFSIHVNVSVQQISSPSYVDELKSVLQQTRLPAKNLSIEVTESRLADSDPVVLDNLYTIKKLGVHIAIDDFGTGYSSLAYLHKLPFDTLKIDRTFINKLDQETADNSIVAAIINITKSLKVNAVAEGVETLEQAELLAQLGCPQAQGYLYSRPVAFDDWPNT